MKRIILIFWVVFYIADGFSQNPSTSLSTPSFCFTPSKSENTELYSSSLRFTNVADSYCLKIYVHVIRRSNSTGGQTVNEVAQALNFLDIDFNPHGIYFQWDGNIDYIDNDGYYDSPTTAIYTVNNHSDGIDIYLFDDSSQQGGRANGVGESSEFWVSGSYWDSPYGSLVKSHVISHEMGHVFFLWHTFHGTYNEGGDSNQCSELVDGSNSSFCGDYVTDTPADPHLQFNVNYPSCTWNSSGNDSNGDNYDPDEALIMTYTHPDCMSYFSIGQGQRMRNAIATLPHLINSVVDCGTDCPSVLTITENLTSGGTDIQRASEYIIASNIIENYATATYKAGQSIDLIPGFQTKSSSFFSAFIESCDDSQNRVNARMIGKSEVNNDQEGITSTFGQHNDFSIYPNPSNGQFNIVYSFENNKKYEVHIYNNLGKIVKAENINLESPVINFYPLYNGVYYLKLFNDNVLVGVSKMIIHN